MQYAVEFQKYRPQRLALLSFKPGATGSHGGKVRLFAIDAHLVDYEFIFRSDKVAFHSRR